MTDRYSKYEGHTPGPWKMRRRDGAPSGDSDNLGWDWDWDHPEANIPPEPMRGLFSKASDAALVTDAPALLAENKRLRETLEMVRAAPTLLAENRRLREVLTIIEIQADDLHSVALEVGRQGEAHNWKQIADMARDAQKEQP